MDTVWRCPPNPQEHALNAPLTEADVWAALLALRRGEAPGSELLDWSARAADPGALRPAARQLLALFLPLLLAPARPYVIAHLAQSLDGHIATVTGASKWITGPADIAHCHRLRALCDAALVGAGTAALDDPRLTVRRVEGPNPLRVVLDPSRRLSPDRAICDGEAETVVLATGPGPDQLGRARVIALPSEGGAIPPSAIVSALGALGVRRLYIEGGGVTVSGFLRAGLLDRLHLCVAPMLLGSGRPGVTLPPLSSLAGALRPRTARYPMGDDLLFDCELRP